MILANFYWDYFAEIVATTTDLTIFFRRAETKPGNTVYHEYHGKLLLLRFYFAPSCRT